MLKELNNDRKTPSSPRNAGIELATGGYVAFLDVDDKFLPDTLERLVEYFEPTKAQMFVFRREYELEFPDMLALSETNPVDMTQETIVLDMKKGKSFTTTSLSL